MFTYEFLPSERAVPTVVLLPGLFAGGWIWDETVARLRAREVGIVRIHEPLGSLEKVIPLETLRDAVASVVGELELSDVVICGNSLGGLVALDFARTFPEKTSAIVVSGAPGLGDDVNLGVGTPRQLTREFAYTVAAQLFYDPSFVTDEMVDRAFEVVSDRRVAVNILRALRAARQYDVALVLPEVTCPVLLVWGEHDRVTPAAPWRAALPAFKRAIFRALPSSGHAPMLERATLFNNELIEFLESVFAERLGAAPRPSVLTT